MSTTVAVFLAGLAGALVLLGLARWRGRSGAAAGTGEMVDPVDPDVAEHWLVERAARWPRLSSALRHADQRVAGGVGVAVAFLVLFGAALFVGWVFESVGSDNGFARWDESAAEWGADHGDSNAATVLSWLTHLGGTPFLAVLMTVVAVVDFRRFRQRAVFAFLATVGVGVVALNNGLKWLIMRERPEVGQLVDAAGSSFPSGHSAAAAACWLAMAIVVGRWTSRAARPWLVAGAVGIAVIVAASRVLLGVHWLTDVVAGLVVGWTWCFVVAIAFGGRLQEFGEPMREVARGGPDAESSVDPNVMNGVRHG